MTMPLPDAPITVHCATCGQPAGWVDCPTGGWWAHHIHPADGHDAVAAEIELIEEIQRLRGERDRYRSAWHNARTRAQGGAADLEFAERQGAAPADPCGAEPVRQAGCPAGGGR